MHIYHTNYATLYLCICVCMCVRYLLLDRRTELINILRTNLMISRVTWYMFQDHKSKVIYDIKEALMAEMDLQSQKICKASPPLLADSRDQQHTV